MTVTVSRFGYEQITAAYRQMVEIGYQPGAPSDGFGNITRTVPLSDEIDQYAARFIREEDAGLYWAGCTDGRSMRAAVLTLEAFRLMNGGKFWGNDARGRELVPNLLRLALKEYESADWSD